MAQFTLPDDLRFNDGPVTGARAYAAERGCDAWLFLCGDEFAQQGGLAWDEVRDAVPHADRVISDPPRTLDLELARRHVAALDALPRPTLVTCRKGPRSSAVAYMYAGLKAGADPQDVVRAGVAAGAPFAAHEEYRAWVASSIAALRPG